MKYLLSVTVIILGWLIEMSIGFILTYVEVWILLSWGIVFGVIAGISYICEDPVTVITVAVYGSIISACVWRVL